jgi:hypothetical protein
MPAGNAWDAGVRPGHTLLTVDGRDVYGEDIGKLTSAAIKQAGFRTPKGEHLLVTVEDRVITQGPIKFSLWLLGALFAVLGSMALLRRPDLSSARWFGAFAGFVAAALAVGPAAGGPQPLWAFVLQILMMIGIGGTCLPFVAALVANDKRLALSTAFAAVAVILVVAYGISVLAAPTLYGIV